MIGERPASIEQRRQIGHWEIDTMMAHLGGIHQRRSFRRTA
jgi:IS30 family transposase